MWYLCYRPSASWTKGNIVLYVSSCWIHILIAYRRQQQTQCSLFLIDATLLKSTNLPCSWKLVRKVDFSSFLQKLIFNFSRVPYSTVIHRKYNEFNIMYVHANSLCEGSKMLFSQTLMQYCSLSTRREHSLSTGPESPHMRPLTCVKVDIMVYLAFLLHSKISFNCNTPTVASV